MPQQRVRAPHPLRLSLLAAAALAASGASFAQSAAAPAAASAPAAATSETQRIEVTGSRIKRIDAEGTSPVQVIRREDIQATGASTVSQMLATLTATTSNGSSITDIGGGNTFSPGASQASLRNLGAQSTLVLLNGRRIAMYPLANYQETFSNLDSLPFEAVDRIEVLKSGGAAIYGSDAVAGVINIITRHDFQGVQLDVSKQRALNGGNFGEKSGSLTAGFGDYAKNGWNVLANVELYKRDSVFWTQDVLKHVNPYYFNNSSLFGTGSTYSYPGNIIGQGPVGGPDACQGTVAANGLCLYDRYSRFQATPEAKRANGIISGTFRINEDTQLYTELLYSKVQTEYQNPYAVYGARQAPVTWIDSQTGQGLEFDYMWLSPNHPLNETGDYADFRYRFVDSNAHETVDTKQYRFMTGLKGAAHGWDYDTSVGVMGGKTTDKQHGAFSASGFRQTIGDWDTSGAASDDFFNKPGGYVIGGQNSPQVLATLFPDYGNTGETKQAWWDGSFTRDLASYPSGTLRLATGFELRHESMKISPSDNLLNGDIVGYGISRSDAGRNFGAVFSEVSIPMAKEVEGTLALRADKYPNFAAHLSPKAGVRWQPASDFMLRATTETGFRAPNLQEAAPSSKTAFQPGVTDSKRCGAATQLSDDYLAAADAWQAQDPSNPLIQIYQAQAEQVKSAECSESVALFTVNNPNLKPETSRSFTFGTAFQLSRSWSVTADYWNITRRNEINLRSVSDLLAGEASLQPGVIVRGGTEGTFTGTIETPDGTTVVTPAAYGLGPDATPIKQVNQHWENLFATHTSGVDFSVKGSTQILPGLRYSTDFDATWTMQYRVYSSSRPNAQGGTGAWGDNLARRYGYPEWQLNWVHTFTTGMVTNSLRWTHSSSQRLQGDWDDSTWDANDCVGMGYNDYQCKISAYNRWDWDVSVNPVKGLSIGAHVFNVFRQRPPVDNRGWDGITPASNDDAAGRQLKLWASYKF